VSPLERRLAAIEAALAGIARGVEVDERPAHELTNAECVEQWHRLCRRQVVGGPLPPASPEEEAETVRQWWEMTS
jgi:hypothetical protein